MKRVKSLDIKYILSQIMYYGANSALVGYASVYLLANGFNNSTIGTVLAMTSIALVFVQPGVASFVDKHVNIKLQQVVNAILILSIIASIGLFFSYSESLLMLVLFIVSVITLQSLTPLINSMAFLFEKNGIEINYGLARGFGSGAYALISMMVGHFVEQFGAHYLPLVYITLNIITVVIVKMYVVPKEYELTVSEKEQDNQVSHISFIEFFNKYKKFMFFVLGSIFVFFSHTIINNFFIQIIRPIGGNEGHMGNAVFIAAILELPAMMLFPVLLKRFKCSTLLKFSIVMFIAKHTLTYLSSDMIMIYGAQVLQMFAFAIFTPASVYYVNKLIDKENLVKGQSMITVIYCASGIIANFAGGLLLDSLGVGKVLLIGVILTVIGALIALFSIEKTN